MSFKTRGRVGIFVAALLGAMLANHVFARRAGADCSERMWRVELVSVTASDGSTEHQAYWPNGGALGSYREAAHLDFDQSTPGAIQQVWAGL
ncbi:MAG TPA: hypothetical protein VER12_06345 [Polyangiaceae bacterium]|nr:hypothetical protein [Polyangiaceae bacterium]